jgi:hypothetical protein
VLLLYYEETQDNSMQGSNMIRLPTSTAVAKCAVFSVEVRGADDGFGGLVDRMLASGSRVRGFKPGRSRWIFFSVKNPQHAFLLCNLERIWNLVLTRQIISKYTRLGFGKLAPNINFKNTAFIAYLATRRRSQSL